MTYCVGILVDDGLVFASDCRTNAGVDHVASFRKLFTFVERGERAMTLLTSGNLAITQSVESLLRRAIEVDDKARSLFRAPTMFDATRMVGRVLREVHDYDANYLRALETEFVAGLILGGQIRGERPRLFQIYAAGNFIEASRQTPYFQIGEVKYGKPVIDRMIRPETDLTTAAKCALISFDSTMRSNISVGLPIDLAIIRKDAFAISRQVRILDGDPYFALLQRRWSEGLAGVFREIPDPDWDAD